MRMKRKRHVAIFLSFLLVVILLIYLAKHDHALAFSTSTSIFKPRTIFHDHRNRLIHTLDHGCYLQSSNFTQHRHSPHLLDKRGCEQKMPAVLIIGGALCGTKTFKSALSYHPDIVVAESDLPTFHDSGDKDRNRFLDVMPHALPNQITVGESQEYLYSRNITKFIPTLLRSDFKVIILVRDPIARAMSEYLVLTSQNRKLSYRASLSDSVKGFAEKNDKIVIMNAPGDERSQEVEHVTKRTKRHVRKDNRDKRKTKTKSKKHNRNKRSADKLKEKGSPSNPVKAEDMNYNLKSTFERTILDSRNHLDGSHFLIQRSVYAQGLKRWKNMMPRENMLILDADAFAREPVATMKIAEKFLKLKPYFKPEFFDFDLPNGALCFNAPMRSCVQLVPVPRPFPVLADSLVSELREFLIPWIKVQNRIAGVYYPHLGEHPLVFTPFK